MGSQQPRPSWFRFPFRFRPASPPPVPAPAPAPAPASPITQPSAPRAPPSPQPQPALVRPAPPPVASPPPPPAAAAAPAAPNTQPSPPAPRTPPSPRPLPTWVRPAPPPVASPPPTVAPAPVTSPVPSVPRFQTATPASRSPVAPSTAPPRSPIPPPPAPAPVASPPAAVAPISPATPAPLPPSITRSPVTASPPPRSTAASPTKSPIVKTSASLPPSPAPEESRKTWTNVPFSSSGAAPPKTKEQVPSSSIRTPVLQKSKLHSPTPIARNASVTGSPPEVVKLLERTSVQSTPIKHVSRPPSPSMLSLPQTKTATDHEPKITVISNGKREPTKDKYSESEEYRMRVIKLAGQNKGAVMELRASGPQSLDKNGEIKTWRNVEKSSTVEGKSVEDKTCGEMFMESPEMTAFMNSNVQGINNSIFYNCSSTHNDPGIHLSLPRKNDKRREWD